MYTTYSTCKILILICAVQLAATASQPSTFKKCAVKDEKFNECVTSAMEDSLNKLRTGMAKPNFPSLEPLEIPSMFIPGGKGSVKVDQNYKDVKIYGLPYLKIQKLQFDLNKRTLDFETVGSNISMKATYDINGKILLLPIRGNGPLTLSMLNSFGVHHIQFEEFEKKGKKYYKALNYNLSMDAEKFIFLLENLFGGEKALGDAMNKLLNENGRDLFLDVRKGYEDSFSIIFKELTNNIFTKIPLNEIFIFNE